MNVLYPIYTRFQKWKLLETTDVDAPDSVVLLYDWLHKTITKVGPTCSAYNVLSIIWYCLDGNYRAFYWRNLCKRASLDAIHRQIDKMPFVFWKNSSPLEILNNVQIDIMQ